MITKGGKGVYKSPQKYDIIFEQSLRADYLMIKTSQVIPSPRPKKALIKIFLMKLKSKQKGRAGRHKTRQTQDYGERSKGPQQSLKPLWMENAESSEAAIRSHIMPV